LPGFDGMTMVAGAVSFMILVQFHLKQ